MIDLPQQGGCLCRAVRYVLRDNPVAVYTCHCTDCQTESGATCHVAVVARAEAIEYTKAVPEPWQLRLADGRGRGGVYCPSCRVNVGSGASPSGRQSLDGGTLDDTSWLRPVAHIWTRSAQPWVRFPQDDLLFEKQPSRDDWLEVGRAWKARNR